MSAPVKASPFVKWGAVICFALAVGLAVFLSIRRAHEVARERDRLQQEKAKGIFVQTIHATETPRTRELNLIADVRPYSQVTLYAKVSGYIKTILVDKGDRVQTGDLLAVIESPETDKAYLGALASAVNTRRIASRYRVLERKGLVSHQEAQQAYTNSDVAQANLETEATLRNYEKVRAPFSGTVTDRYVDPGQLIQNGGDSPGALALFNISDLEELRVYCYVNQSDAFFVRAGAPATLSMRERPNTAFRGQVTRISGDLDAKTRMMLAEIDLSNRDALIVPGSYGEIRIRVSSPPLVAVPTGALVSENGRDSVVVVSPERRADFRTIRLADNNGLQILISEGLKVGEEVVLNPPQELGPGAPLQPRAVDQHPARKQLAGERGGS